MTISYVNFMKHAQAVSKASSAGRPVLKGVMHRDGDLIVTDSHRLYHAKDLYEGAEKNINPKTGDLIEGNYPDVNRLLPDPHEAKLSVLINIEEAYKALKVIEAACKIDKRSNHVEIEVVQNVLAFSTDKNAAVFCSYDAEAGIAAEEFKMTANVKFVTEALALMKDTGVAAASFNFYGVMRPFTFTSNNLTALILPVRTY